MGKKYLETKANTLESAILGVWKEAVKVTETNKNDKSDDGEGLDAVQPKAVKKKFKDRKDTDIDNDGDTDSSDKFLHKRRKAISKAIAKDEAKKESFEVDEAKIDPTVAPKSAKVIGNKEDGYRLRMFFPDGHDETLPEIGRPDMNGLKSIIDKNILKHKKGIRKSWIPVVSAAMKKKPIDEGFGVAEDIPAMELGTDRYRDHTVGVTPGENAEWVDAARFKVSSMKEALAKVWGLDEKALDKSSKEGYDDEDEKMVKGNKTTTGKLVAKVDLNPKIKDD
jgi:hypothetical protein